MVALETTGRVVPTLAAEDGIGLTEDDSFEVVDASTDERDSADTVPDLASADQLELEGAANNERAVGPEDGTSDDATALELTARLALTEADKLEVVVVDTDERDSDGAVLDLIANDSPELGRAANNETTLKATGRVILTLAAEDAPGRTEDDTLEVVDAGTDERDSDNNVLLCLTAALLELKEGAKTNETSIALEAGDEVALALTGRLVLTLSDNEGLCLPEAGGREVAGLITDKRDSDDNVIDPTPDMLELEAANDGRVATDADGI